MRLEAISQQLDPGGKLVPAGKMFDASTDEANRLIALGYARLPRARVTYSTKVIVPTAPEVVAGQPFRDVHHADQKPASLHSPGHPLLPVADTRAEGTSDTGRREKR